VAVEGGLIRGQLVGEGRNRQRSPGSDKFLSDFNTAE
jgi:hypothetical protein